jgi:hypothetical protein
MTDKTERDMAVAYLRGQAEIYFRNAKKFGVGKDRHELLGEYVKTGDRGALECYRMFYIAEAFIASADAIEDGRHLAGGE